MFKHFAKRHGVSAILWATIFVAAYFQVVSLHEMVSVGIVHYIESNNVLDKFI